MLDVGAGSVFDDDKTGPFSVAGYNIAILMFVAGQQYSGRELTQMLTVAGFTDIRITAAFHLYGVIEAKKP